MVHGEGTMHDTIQNLSNCTGGVCETSFDPRKVAAERDFASEYRYQLQMLKMQVTSDYDELKKKYHSQTRRIEALEGLVPCVRMQEHQIQEVSREVRAMKRAVQDLQVAVEEKKQPLFKRLMAHLSLAMQ
jgi:predicted RNase H-like nuclease (RuvC/YqgF family)